MYHRKDGQIVKLMDDILSATRYGIMMKRFAKTKAEAVPNLFGGFGLIQGSGMHVPLDAEIGY